MTQQRPSEPSDHHIEYVSGDPTPEGAPVERAGEAGEAEGAASAGTGAAGAGAAGAGAAGAASAGAAPSASSGASSGPDAVANPDAAPAAEQRPRTGIPHQQSRPGPDDDIMLATGKPRRPASTRAGETFVQSERRKQEKIRRQPGRRAWVPNQHGAWSMLVLSLIHI